MLTVKVAEVLRERADARKRAAAYAERATGSARHQEGEEPAEDPGESLRKARDAMAHHSRLVCAINLSNAATILPGGQTVTEAIARRDLLREEIKLLREAADAAAGIGRGRFDMYRSARSELTMHAALPVSELRAEADQLSAEHRHLDNLIEATNWATEVSIPG